MPRNEEGDFELVLGNRQLQSVFFILVVLLGIFFTMGYILGRNTLGGEGVEVAGLNKPSAETTPRDPIVVEPARPGEPVKPAESKPRPAPTQSEPVKPAVESKPEPPKPVETKPPAVKPPEPKPVVEHKPTPPPPKAEVKPSPVKPKPAEPAVGAAPASGQTFLQVAAVGKSEGELYAEVLAKKGFQAIVAPGPTPTIVRVLVGPLKDPSAIARAKADLEAIGIKPIVRKF
jgi:cell division septation protein DedD